MSTLHVIDHPLITHKLTIMRRKETGSKDFRELLNEIAMLMGYEITRDLPLEDIEIETPVSKMIAKTISGKKLAIVPILRAGLGMVDGLLSLVPVAKVGHIGLYRDPATHKPVEYYCKLPADIEERITIVVDPMLATGGSSSDALTMLKAKGIKNLKLMCLVAAPEGVRKVQEDHPDVDIYIGSRRRGRPSLRNKVILRNAARIIHAAFCLSQKGEPYAHTDNKQERRRSAAR